MTGGSPVAGIAEYSWIEGLRFDALTLTWVDYAGEPADVLRAAGHTWEQRPVDTYDSVLELVDGYDFDREPLLVGRIGGWMLLLARNGYEFSYAGVAAGASRLGRVISVFWNVNAVMRFLLADDGRIRRSFDPLLPDDSEGLPLPEEAGLPFGEPGAGLRAATLVLAERLSGVRVTEDWLLDPHDVVIVRRREWAPDDPRSTAMVPFTA